MTTLMIAAEQAMEAAQVADSGMAKTLIIAAVVLFGLTLVFATLLGVAKEKLRVDEDPRIGEVNEVLPAANCGGCGYAGCADFAKAVVEGRAKPNGCPVGGAECAAMVAKILGIQVTETYPYRPVIHCAAKTSDKIGVVAYEGVQSCLEANAVGTTQACTYGCLGMGDCAKACTFDALHMVDGKPVVDYEKCTGCGACVVACPRNLIEQIPFKQDRMLVVACANKEPAKAVKAVCKVGCVGCGICKRKCSEIFEVKDNLAFIDYVNYSEAAEGFAEAQEKCPADAMVYFGKPKPEYAEKLAADEATGAKSQMDAVKKTQAQADKVAQADDEGKKKAFGDDDPPKGPIN